MLDLERALAILGDKGDLPGWYNQIPVASGFMDEWADKRAAVDLLYTDGNQVDLVELKWASDTPLYALFEILRYGLVFLFCRQNAAKFSYEDKTLLSCRDLILTILAPHDYYKGFSLHPLAAEINQGLRSLAENNPVFPQYAYASCNFLRAGNRPLLQAGKSIIWPQAMKHRPKKA